MGKYSMTRSVNQNNQRQRELYGYSAINDDASAKVRYLLSDVNFLGVAPFKLYDQYNYMNDYLKNRGLSWSDMKYPALAPYSGGMSGAYHYVSSNIKRLYL